MNDNYKPVVYVWIECPFVDRTKTLFMLTQYLGGDWRIGDAKAIRCHIWLSDNNVIQYREPLPTSLSEVPSEVHTYAEEVRHRIVEYVCEIRQAQRVAGVGPQVLDPKEKKIADDILDDAHGVQRIDDETQRKVEDCEG